MWTYLISTYLLLIGSRNTYSSGYDNMKKILYSLFAIAFVLPLAVNAATFSFSPNSGSFAPKSTFSVVVYVNPNVGEEITTAKLSALFSVSGLEVVSFAQADGWIPLVAPGSDLKDNVAGKLIKTGGFPARVKESKQFGTITLRTKSVGTATLNTAGDSMLLDSSNTNKYVSSAGVNFTIVVPVSAPTPTGEGAVLGEETPVVQEPTTASQPIAAQSLLAAVGSIVTLGTDSVIVGLLVAVIILALAGYAIYPMIQRARRKNLGKLR